MSRDPMQHWCSRPDKRVMPAAEPVPPVEIDWRYKFERSQQRWGNLKARVKAEIVALDDPSMGTQQRSQYANGVARLRWVLDEMAKSPDVLAEAVPPVTCHHEFAEFELCRMCARTPADIDHSCHHCADPTSVKNGRCWWCLRKLDTAT